MRRAEILEGVRMLKLRDILPRWEVKQISQLEAAELMGVSEQTFRRWTRRFEEEGEAGLVDRRLGKPSPRRYRRDLLGLSGGRRGHALDPARAARGDRAARSAVQPLHRSRQPLFRDTESWREAGPAGAHPGRPGLGTARHRAHPSVFARGAGPL